MKQPPGFIYHITISEHLDRCWAGWFEHLTVSYDTAGNTVLAGPVVDQAALRGILSRLWDLNLTLISLVRIESKQEDPTNDDINTVV